MLQSLLKFAKDGGGDVIWVILFFCVVALFIFLAKVFQLHRDEVTVRDLIKGVTGAVRRDNVVEAISLCSKTFGPVPRVLSAALHAYERGDKDIMRSIDSAAMDEISRLERGIGFLGTICTILPLLGFLGTVFGMMGALDAVLSQLTMASIAVSLKTALVTTATALVAAIPCNIAYNYLVGRVNAILLEMEKSGLEMGSILMHFQDNDRKEQ